MEHVGIFIAFAVAFLVVCFIMAKIMVSKRISMGNDFIIGNDGPNRIDELKEIAVNEFSNQTYDKKGDYTITEKVKEEGYQISKIVEKGKVIEVKVKTERTCITAKDNGEELEMDIHKSGCSETKAIMYLTFELWVITYAIFFAIFGPAIINA